jgi:hypothetical protein
MPAIGVNDQLLINGKRVTFQGIARIKEASNGNATTIQTDVAAKATKLNGLDEMIFAFRGADGKVERIIIWGDQLDFTFRERQAPPEITLNGERGTLIHFDDEQSSFVEGAVFGILGGFKSAFDAIEAIAKRSIVGAALAGAAAAVGGTIWVVASGGTALPQIISAVGFLGPQVAAGVGVISLAALGLILLCGLVKGAATALGTPPKFETIAAIISDQPERLQAPPVIPPAPQLPAPQLPAPQLPAPVVPAPLTPAPQQPLLQSTRPPAVQPELPWVSNQPPASNKPPVANKPPQINVKPPINNRPLVPVPAPTPVAPAPTPAPVAPQALNGEQPKPQTTLELLQQLQRMRNGQG